jgi:hypothetical protein
MSQYLSNNTYTLVAFHCDVHLNALDTIHFKIFLHEQQIGILMEQKYTDLSYVYRFMEASNRNTESLPAN